MNVCVSFTPLYNKPKFRRHVINDCNKKYVDFYECQTCNSFTGIEEIILTDYGVWIKFFEMHFSILNYLEQNKIDACYITLDTYGHQGKRRV